MNSTITDSLNFKAIQLNAKEATRAKTCIDKLLDLGITPREKQIVQNDLFVTLNPHIQKEAQHKTVFGVFEEVLAEMYLLFSELLNDIQNNSTLGIFLQKLNEYKPSKDTLKFKYTYKSLNKNAYWDNEMLEKIDFITSAKLPQPKTSEYLESVKTRVKKAVEQANMSTTVKNRVLARLKGITYKDIAKKDNINISVAKLSVKKGVLKIQHANGNLPKNFIQKAEAIANVFHCDVEKAIKFILKNPAILSEKPETIMQNIEDIVKLLHCPKEKLIKICLKYPDICLQKPETLMNNISKSTELLGCSKEAFIKAGFNLPPLLYLKPETLIKNVQKASEYFNCSVPDYIKAALRQSQLFCQRPETLNNNVENTAKLLKCSKEEIVKAALYEPSLFCLKPETILRNVAESSKLLHCTEKEFIQIALRSPKLFYLRAETLSKKVKEISKSFGCSEYECMKLALNYPYLLCQNTKTIGEKLKAENYYRKIKNEEPKKVPCKNSKESTYLNILVYLLQKAKFDGTEDFIKIKRNFNLQEFTKTFKDKTFSLEIPEDDAAKGFVKFVQDSSINTIGKNIFEFKIMEKQAA